MLETDGRRQTGQPGQVLDVHVERRQVAEDTERVMVMAGARFELTADVGTADESGLELKQINKLITKFMQIFLRAPLPKSSTTNHKPSPTHFSSE